MTKEEATRVDKLFQEFVNANVTVKYVAGPVCFDCNGQEGWEYVIQPNAIIGEKDWQIIEGFSHLAHLCVRYQVHEMCWKLW